MGSISYQHTARLLIFVSVGDYSVFIQDWTSPNGGIHGYLSRFLDSGDSTFQHIAIWTLVQLLESEDDKLIDLIHKAEDVVKMVQTIADKNDSDDDDIEDGEGEVIALARRACELLGKDQSQRPTQESTQSSAARPGLVDG